MTKQPPTDDVTDAEIEVGEPKDWAAGVPGVLHSMGPALEQLGAARTAKLMLALNQKGGFDCMSCAWPDPDKRKTAEFCENGGKAVVWEATPVLVPRTFWAEHSVDDLADKTEYWLYPKKGLLIAISSDGKVLFQYISPKDFSVLTSTIPADASAEPAGK